MKRLLYPLILLTYVTSAHALNLDIGFNDANGTSLNATGAAYGTWDYGGAQTNTRGSNSGHLNVGYTHYYKGVFNNNADPVVAQINTGNVFRRFTLSDAVTQGAAFTFTVVYDSWQLNDAKTAGMGLGFALENGNGNSAMVALKSGSGSFSTAYSQGQGAVSGSYAGSTSGIGLSNAFYLTGNNANEKDLTLQVNGDLSTGAWSARMSLDSNHDNTAVDTLTWTDLGSGTGLTSITGIQMRVMNGGGSWGSATAGNDSDNWVTVDNISLDVAAVPEPSASPLFMGLIACSLVVLRRRF